MDSQQHARTVATSAAAPQFGIELLLPFFNLLLPLLSSWWQGCQKEDPVAASMTVAQKLKSIRNEDGSYPDDILERAVPKAKAAARKTHERRPHGMNRPQWRDELKRRTAAAFDHAIEQDDEHMVKAMSALAPGDADENDDDTDD